MYFYGKAACLYDPGLDRESLNSDIWSSRIMCGMTLVNLFWYIKVITNIFYNNPAFAIQSIKY